MEQQNGSPAPFPFEGYTFYSYPSKDGYDRVQLFKSNTDRHSMSLGRYHACIKYGRILENGERVIHLNKDHTDHNHDNLFAGTSEEIKAFWRQHHAKVCGNPRCDNKFYPVRSTSKYCSRDCRAKAASRPPLRKVKNPSPLHSCECVMCEKTFQSKNPSSEFCSKTCRSEFMHFALPEIKREKKHGK